MSQLPSSYFPIPQARRNISGTGSALGYDNQPIQQPRYNATSDAATSPYSTPAQRNVSAGLPANTGADGYPIPNAATNFRRASTANAIANTAPIIAAKPLDATNRIGGAYAQPDDTNAFTEQHARAVYGALNDALPGDQNATARNQQFSQTLAKYGWNGAALLDHWKKTEGSPQTAFVNGYSTSPAQAQALPGKGLNDTLTDPGVNPASVQPGNHGGIYSLPSGEVVAVDQNGRRPDVTSSNLYGNPIAKGPALPPVRTPILGPMQGSTPINGDYRIPLTSDLRTNATADPSAAALLGSGAAAIRDQAQAPITPQQAQYAKDLHAGGDAAYVQATRDQLPVTQQQQLQAQQNIALAQAKAAGTAKTTIRVNEWNPNGVQQHWTDAENDAARRLAASTGQPLESAYNAIADLKSGKHSNLVPTTQPSAKGAPTTQPTDNAPPQPTTSANTAVPTADDQGTAFQQGITPQAPTAFQQGIGQQPPTAFQQGVTPGANAPKILKGQTATNQMGHKIVWDGTQWNEQK